ncbi:hypothetical protein CPB86DRAFT_605457 [Serendipita vermifera]|nr:hypothetical protein CPB86DRAFT_605457 [Serendipita vermifera]
MATSYSRLALTLILWILLTKLMSPVRGGYNVTVSHTDPMIEYGGLGWTPYIYDAVRAPSCVPTEYGRWSDEQDISVSFTFTGESVFTLVRQPYSSPKGTAVYLLGFVDSSGAIMNVTIDGKFVNILNTSNANLVGCTIPWSKTNLKPRRHTVKFAKIVETRFRVIGFM